MLFSVRLIRPFARGARGIVTMQAVGLVSAVNGGMRAPQVRARHSAGQPARHDEQSNQKKAQNLSGHPAHGVSKPKDLGAVKANPMNCGLT